MVSGKRLFFLLLLILSFTGIRAACFIEYESLADYLNAHLQGKHDGMDGHWLKVDRQKNNRIWGNANKINIEKTDGFKEYGSISQRSDFYKWFQQQTDSAGFETRWGFAAALTTKKLENLLTNAAQITGSSNAEIQSFVYDGNRIIFDDIWIDLKLLYEQKKPLTGKNAEIWDGNLLLKEQNLIEPYYQKLSASSLAKLEKLLRKENFFSRLLPGYEFEGTLISIPDRWFYGMKMMGYKKPDFKALLSKH
ncbi:hypothetical protein [Pedobacter punctiformis]|uniref:YARHG domain-containing protein n=1 Tax=Pedobacter punctiformis TaxID=3004097 RepID=A0ABT4L3C8_9SPHI|nr:hypothetical protein [Pedobacter sp. HCMS5-2]MCZ4242424.1 hypothetical protein [Pedobacter sp. HCMS5-2]